jgi:hypothetical protein
VRALGVVELQRAGERVEHAVRRAGQPSLFWMMCSTLSFIARSRPSAWASRLVGARFRNRLLPSSLFAQPPPGCGTVHTFFLATPASTDRSA